MSSTPFHHSAFYHGAKKTTPLKIRNPSIHPSQIMPSPSGIPFNISDMPWCFAGKPDQVKEFSAVIRPSPIVPNLLQQQCQYQQIPNMMFADLRKRKTEPDTVEIPVKQFLSEEAMASHLNNLHLSTEYTSHNIETTSDDALTCSDSGLSSLDDDMSLGEPLTEPSGSRHIFMSPKELEDRLKKAQRISLCEEVRKLDSREDILPKVLLERIEKPCTALVLWQPPKMLEKLVAKVSTALKEKEEEEQQRSQGMMMGDDEPLPDLPDFDNDLDFEENNNNIASVSDLNSMDVEM